MFIITTFRELRTITERHAYINWHFQCSVVSVNVCKEYLNMAIFKTPVVVLIKTWTLRYINRLPTSSHTGVIVLLEYGPMFWPILYSMVGRWMCCISHSAMHGKMTDLTLHRAEPTKQLWRNLAWLTTSGIPPHMTTFAQRGWSGQICVTCRISEFLFLSFAFFFTFQGCILGDLIVL